MNFNQAIANSAYKAVHGLLRTPDASGLCLALVRMIVEDALFNGQWRFYEWLTNPVERKPGAPGSAFTPVARDMERSLTRAGMAVPVPTHGRHADPKEAMKVLRPGDLLFRWDAAAWQWGGGGVEFYGHVGVFLHGALVLENINPNFRNHSFKLGVEALTPLHRYPFTTAIRFDPETPPADPG